MNTIDKLTNTHITVAIIGVVLVLSSIFFSIAWSSVAASTAKARVVEAISKVTIACYKTGSDNCKINMRIR